MRTLEVDKPRSRAEGVGNKAHSVPRLNCIDKHLNSAQQGTTTDKGDS